MFIVPIPLSIREQISEKKQSLYIQEFLEENKHLKPSFKEKIEFINGFYDHQERLNGTKEGNKVSPFWGKITKVTIKEVKTKGGWLIGKKGVIEIESYNKKWEKKIDTRQTGFIEYNGNITSENPSWQVSLARTIVSTAYENIGNKVLIWKSTQDGHENSDGVPIKISEIINLTLREKEGKKSMVDEVVFKKKGLSSLQIPDSYHRLIIDLFNNNDIEKTALILKVLIPNKEQEIDKIVKESIENNLDMDTMLNKINGK